ncbi:hypothetical protein DQ04_00021070 [Trypanosoma grayi]|uniref:hypothetical protein n=1 Tax=Trypanosoma grayi TaxID=71804 RepID=UPI0004F42342|nr:hypothetical protein DQ04_00021070 [Trypanosoma grayi]KEG15609.1 hypothetical protein DQ04_00021070 [Trypanosoma grayi]
MDDHPPPLRPLSELPEAEAAALLAEYGTSGPYDDLLSFPAVSNCVFEYGGRDVFLTGAGPDDGDDDDDNKNATGFGRNSTDGVDSTWPLECLLLRHTKLLSSTTAVPLWDGVKKVLNGEEGHALAVHRDAPSTKTVEDAVEKAGDLLLPDVFPDDGSNEGLFNTIDSMLREADVVLARRKPYVDPMSEAALLERQRAVEEEERCWPPIHNDAGDGAAADLTEGNSDSEEEEAREKGLGDGEATSLFAYEFGPTAEEVQTLREWDEAVARCERQNEALASAAVHLETPDIALGAEQQSAAAATVAPLMLPLQLEEGEAAETVEATTVVATTQPSWVDQHEAILQSIQTMEVRDSEVQAVASQRLLQMKQENRRPRRIPPGQLVLDGFVARVDVLLPPCEVEVELRTAVALETEDDTAAAAAAAGDGVSVGAEKSLLAAVASARETTKVSSVEQIQKKAEREIFLVRREAYEARCMQEEDTKASYELQWREEKTRRIQEAIADCVLREDAAYRCILAEELAEHQELCKLEHQQDCLLKEIEFQRKAHATAQIVCGILEEHARIRRVIIATEEEDAKELVRAEQEALQLLLRSRKQLMAQISSCVEQWDTAMEVKGRGSQAPPAQGDVSLATAAAWQRLAEVRHSNPSLACSVVLPISSMSRLQALLQEERHGTAWRRDCKQIIADTAGSLAAFAHSVAKCAGKAAPMPGSRPGTATTVSGTAASSASSSTPQNDALSSSTNDAFIRLDAKLAKQLQPLVFGVAKAGMREVAQQCHTVSFALEQIASIDFASLATLEVRTDAAAESRVGRRATPAAPFVRELDLGGNALHVLPLDDLLRVFPSLRSLNMSDNGLKSLTCRAASMRGVSEAHVHSVAQAACVSRLDVSLNALSSVEAIGKLLSYNLHTLVMYANQIESLLPLASCESLVCLEASRNNVTSLAELQQLRLLQTLDLSENGITNLDALAQHVLLQNLYLSRNQIQTLPRVLSLGFLRQLFMNENRLEELPGECFRWLPLLSVLHVENNRLRDLSGLAHCPRLTNVSVAFNQLQQVEDLQPLAACKKLQTLYVSENPFARGDHEAGTDDQSDKNGNGNSGRMPEKVRRALLAWFPRLIELNNEKVEETDRRDATRAETVSLRSFCAARELLRQHNESALHGTRYWPSCSTPEDVRGFYGAVECYSRYASPMRAQKEMFAALTSDVVLTSIQTEQDVLATVRRRRQHDAVHIEDELRQRLRESKQRLNPVVHRLSDKVEERNRRDTMLTLQRHLTAMQTIPRVQANIHTRPALYHERAQAHREAQAKVVLCDWLYLRMLGRRAKKELAVRRAAQLKRYEVAARIIQPVWRGAALRSRLKRILHPAGDDDDDDDGQFAHVSVDFLLEGTEAVDGDGGVGAVLQTVLQAHGAPPNFPAVLSSARTGLQQPQQMGLRPSSAAPGPLRCSSSSGDSKMRRPESQPQSLQVTQQQSPPPPPPSLSSSSRLDDEWGALVSSQLRKRQKKMDRAQRENMQREFMKDPLKVKRALKSGDA